jgi:UDP-N-acetylmuramate dehydrogenase
VIRLTRGFGDIEVQPDGVIAGAAALDAVVAEHAAAAGLAGLEFLSGIPGTIGGAVTMNAGAYGGDVANTLDWAEFLTRQGELRRLNAGEIGFSYRHSGLPPESVVVRARFTAQPGDPAAIAARMTQIRQSREATQPVRARTGGSTFRNPPDAKAWELIDAAGCRGLTRGGAQVSEKHCNFLINTGGATAADLEGLGEEVRRRVHDTSGISLVWEIKRIGIPAGRPEVVA